ncbi:hypothetical protein AB0C69_20210 [Actinomadura sp. NPDC048032]|uniref:hypothetical protein n=1 Tax=Actinomadura sp. NPDC048032 TaxID=3155747 RepID=UPI0033E18495
MAVSRATFVVPRPGTVEADAGGVSDVGVLPKPVDSDAVQPVSQVVADGAVGGGDGEAAVAVGDLFGELVGRLFACGAVDADAFAGAIGSEDVAGGFPAAVLALVDGAFAVGAALALGCGHQAASSR